MIWANTTFRDKIIQSLGILETSPEELSKVVKDKLLPFATPPLSKNVGLAKELFAFYRLIKEKIGFVIPILLY
ncbi:MAG: hypothetical protein ACUVTD_09110 [Nitrososphaerales archaeon]